MIDFKEDEKLSVLNHSCAHVMAQAINTCILKLNFGLVQLLVKDSIMMLI